MNRVVRHKDVAKATHGHRDKFRICLSERGQRKYIGQKDIPAVVLASVRDTLPEIKDNFSSLKKDSLSGATVTDGKKCMQKWISCQAEQAETQALGWGTEEEGPAYSLLDPGDKWKDSKDWEGYDQMQALGQDDGQ